MRNLAFLLSLILVSPSLAQRQDDRSRGPRFTDVVQEHFGTWDSDGSGDLSAAEIDAACVDPEVKGAEAAAIAALKRVVRSGQYDLPSLTQEFLVFPPQRGRRETGDTDRVDSGETRAPLRRSADFQSRYSMALRRIQGTPRDLFLDSTPDLDRARQGPLGDCFLVAPVGAALMRDPDAIKQMITPKPDGGYRVTFPSGRVVEFPELTDAELALTSSTGDEGIWLAVLEKALGTLWMELYPDRHTMLSATDAIAQGGTTSSIIRLFTGHEVEHIALRRGRGGNEQSEAPTGQEPDENRAAEIDAAASRVRVKLVAALGSKRLATATTAEDKYPPGISQRHAFAVLSYNEELDAVTLWNPHGSTFRPRGEPGLEYGYVQRSGMLTVPLQQFVQVFSGVVVETDRPISARSRQRGQGRR